ncbi:hypothetical protein ACTUSX_11540 [Pantoea ananatis]
MFECVNESDEKGDGSYQIGYVARVGGDGDVHNYFTSLCPFAQPSS